MCYEHTASEGVAVVTAMLNVFKYIEENLNEQIIEILEEIPVKFEKLEFVVNDDIEKMIEKAAKKFDELDSDSDIEVFKFEDFGKTFIKSCNCSPDAFMQMSLQLAYYR